MKTRVSIFIVLGITAILAIVYGSRHFGPEVAPIDVSGYVVTHISELSPLPASLGGTFYVTKIMALDGKGVVEYEDGHSAYVADFTYFGTRRGGIRIGSFDIRE